MVSKKSLNGWAVGIVLLAITAILALFGNQIVTGANLGISLAPRVEAVEKDVDKLKNDISVNLKYLVDEAKKKENK